MKKTVKRRKYKQQKMSDILLPLLLVIVILPLLVHLAVYSCGYGDYIWYADDDTIADFYCYYKSYFFAFIGIFAFIVLVFRFALYRETIKDMRCYLPLFCYGVFVIVSTIVSVNKKASLQGNFESFESCMVLLAYIIISIYAYQVVEDEQDYKIIWGGILAICMCFIVIGMFQVFRHDLMNYEFVQKIVLPPEAYQDYIGEITDVFSGNNVYLTLYNPNYAGIFLSMMHALMITMFLSETERKKQIIYGSMEILLFLLIWYTYSRTSFITAIMTLIIAVVFLRKKRQEHRGSRHAVFVFFAAAVIVMATLTFADYKNGWKYLSRMVEQNERERLDSLVTDERGIQIVYDGDVYQIWTEGERLYCSLPEGQNISVKRGDKLLLPFEKDAKVMYMDVEQPEIVMYLAQTTMVFVKDQGTYYYRTEQGKLTQIKEVEAVDFHGLEYLASARGYIWSRVLPILKHYFIVGSGPDTFAEVFPQEDYAGKIVYSDRPDMVIEKAHNDYLTKWVQTGMFSVISIVVFYIFIIIRGGSFYRKVKELDSMAARLGFGCYLACLSYMAASLFNDSTLQTSPLFFVLAGIVLAVVAR